MAPKKLSYEEKRTRLLQLFYETEDFYNLKELEKLGHKNKGIVSQTVKEILQSLVDDRLVESERIGISNYFWAYPSKGFQVRQEKIKELEAELELIRSNTALVEKNIVEKSIGREKTEEHDQQLEKLNQFKSKHKILEEEYQQFKDSDPEIIEEQRKKIKFASQSANRWTDNIFNVRSWCRDKFNIDCKEIDKNFDIPEDFDYVPEE